MISRMRGSSCCKTSIWVHRRHAHGRLPRGTCWKSGEMLERRDGRWARLPHADLQWRMGWGKECERLCAGCATAGRNCRWRLISVRSEEHTSELQSHSDLVCRLLLEKKKNTSNMILDSLVIDVITMCDDVDLSTSEIDSLRDHGVNPRSGMARVHVTA